MCNVRRFAKYTLPDYTFNDKNVYFTKFKIWLSINRTIKNNDKNNYPSDNYKTYNIYQEVKKQKTVLLPKQIPKTVNIVCCYLNIILRL
jgi:hypothetical protein